MSGSGAVRIRKAKAADEAAIHQVAERAFALYVAAIGARPAPMDADYRAHIENGSVLVAEAAGQCAGFAVCYPEAPDAWHLETVAVAPERQGEGIGGRLIAACEARAGEAGAAFMRLYTNVAMTGNLTLYPRLGYRETRRARQHGFDRVFFEKPLAGG
ncbi:MAG: GNAT family N-acetyltransferase [Rhizobiaceae bacterium]